MKILAVADKRVAPVPVMATTLICIATLAEVVVLTFGKSPVTYLSAFVIAVVFVIFVALKGKTSHERLQIAVKLAAYGLTASWLLITAVELLGIVWIYAPSLRHFPWTLMFAGPLLSLATSWCVWHYYQRSGAPALPAYVWGALACSLVAAVIATLQ